jgi:NAD(P)-dependent dehydrogenase (short-subunit alcohol dehydrogenase family)
VIAVNLTGAFLISKAVMPLIRAAKGSVAHMASVQGFASQAGVVAYASTG